jgi:predicted amidophosphoribosyltransferase
MFCRNCGKELIGTPEICMTCGARPLAATAFCPACGATTNPLSGGMCKMRGQSRNKARSH